MRWEVQLKVRFVFISVLKSQTQVGVLLMQVFFLFFPPLMFQIGSPLSLLVPLGGNLKLYLNTFCYVGILGSDNQKGHGGRFFFKLVLRTDLETHDCSFQKHDSLVIIIFWD